MKFDVYLDEKTFRNFTRFDILKRRKYWRSPVIFASIMCTAGIIAFIMHKVDGAVLLGVVLTLIGAGMPAVYFLTFFSSLKKQVKAQNLNPPRLVYSFDLTEKGDGIGISNGKETANYEWKRVFHAYRDQKCIYLFMTSDRAFLIPNFENPASTETIWSMIEKKAGKEKCTVLK